MSLYYPIDNLVPNITNTFNVYLRMENGTGEMGIETMELVRKSYADSIGKALIGAFGKPIDLA